MRSLISAFCLALAVNTSIVAQEKPATAPAPAPLDPKYVAAITRMEQTLQTLPSYTVDVKLEWKAGDGSSGTNFYSLRFERPGKFRIETRAADATSPNLIAACDGKVLTTYLPDKKLYNKVPLANPAQLLEVSPILGTHLKGSLIDSVMRPGLKNYVLARSRDAALVGQEPVDGQTVDHFHLTWGRDQEEFWLGPENQTLPRRLIRIYNFPGKDEAALKLTTTTTLTWSVGKPIEASQFTISPAPDAKEVDDLEVALTTGTNEMLVGKPEPEITLPKLGGGEVKLADLKGKSNVLLIFWASWNSQAVDALKSLAKLQPEFKDVTFLAVNAGEDTPAVASYLEKQPTKLDVLLDTNDKAIELFGITNLPSLVLINKEGIVHSVHEVDDKDFLKDVRSNLEKLAHASSK